jgi:predicted nucleotidyltransferase
VCVPRAELVLQLRRALASEPGVELALLFGSRAEGREGPASDVDVALRAPGVDALDLAGRLSLALGIEVDVSDVDAAGYPMLRELVEHSIVVAEARPGTAALWRSHALATLDTDRVWFERMRDAYLARTAASMSRAT